jgi:hypothetical protein
MTNHPLTDKKLKELFWDHAVNTGWDECDWTSDGMRAAYDLGADRQLEQVIDWIEEYLTAGDVISESLIEAMRPQQQENNQ